MATDTSFPATRGNGASKRKRDPLDIAGPITRGAPNTRRTSAQNAAQQQTNSSLSNAGATATMASMTSDGFHAPTAGNNDDATRQFDFSLQQSSSEGSMAPPGAPTQDPNSTTSVDTAAAALSQHYSMQVPRHTDDSFASQTANEADDNGFSLEGGAHFSGLDGTSTNDHNTDPSSSMAGKPPVGSEEWHKVRKDNHKEVERRRRETINEGINELAKIVPGCEKNKGSILGRAVQYIAKLQEEASANIDKWTFEKLVTDQAIAEISAKLSRAWAEKEAWKRLARQAGVDVDNVDLEVGGDGGAEGVGAAGDAEARGAGAAGGVQPAEGPAATANMQAAPAVDDAVLDAK